MVSGVRAACNNTLELNEFFDIELKSNASKYVETLHNFTELKSCFKYPPPTESNNLSSVHQLTVNNVKLGIGCLNSAWLAYGGDADKGYMFVCERQVDSVLEKIKDCDVKVALMHHPLEWLVPFDRKDVENILRLKFNLLFTGHLHDPEPNFTQKPGGNLFHSEGGTLFNGDRKSYQGYTIIKKGSDKISLYFRKYVDSRRQFDKDIERAPDGYWEFHLVSKTQLHDIKKGAPKLSDTDAFLKSMLNDMQTRLKVPLYVPLTCAHDISIHQSDIALKDEVDKFLNSQASVLLLLGDSGAGKSTFCAHLFSGLKDAYLKDTNAPVPVFIKLGPLYEGVKAGTFVDDELRRYKLDPSSIEGLKQGKSVIFFLDGYDELGEKLRLFQGDWLNSWTNVKVIVTCRNQHISKSDEFHLFQRVDSLTSRPDEKGFRSLYITPLSDNQVDAYLEEFVKTLEAQWKTPEAYKKQILTIYNLRELSSNPLLLNILVNTLPSLIEDNKVSAINRSSIYNEFIRQWFINEMMRLKSGTIDIDYFFEFAEVLAFEMFIEGKVQIELPKKSLFGRKKEQESLQYRLLTSVDNNYAKFRSGCPIQRVKDETFTFMHKSYQEYFVARRLQQDISKGSEDALNKKLLTKEPAIIAFLSEMEVDKSTLLNIVKESKTNTSIETAASNAATILNAHRFCFSGCDLRGVRIPGADLSCAVLDYTDMSKADLRSVSFRKAFLRNTTLIESCMEDVEFGEMPYLQGHSNDVTCVAISADGMKIVSGSKDNTLRIWDIATGNLLKTLEGHSSVVSSVAISADDKKIVSGSKDNTVKIWEMATGIMIKTLQEHSDDVTSVAISADGMKIVSGSDDNTVKIWDMPTGSLINNLQGHNGYVKSVAISPDGTKIVSASSDNTLRIWDIVSDSLPITLKGHNRHVRSVAISSNGMQIVSGSDDKTLRIWDMATGSLLNTLEGHVSSVYSVAITADGTKIVSGSDDKTLRIWDMATGSLLNTLEGHSNAISSVAISADCMTIVSGSRDKTLRIWDMTTDNLINNLQGHSYTVISVAISPDGTKIVSGSRDKTLRIWEMATGNLTNNLQGHSNDVTNVAISPDGTKIVSGSRDKTLRIWDMATGSLINTLQGHSNDVTSVAINHDGTKIVSGSSDETLRIWDMATGNLINNLQGHSNAVTSVAISPDGTKIVSGSEDKTLRIWDMITGSLINTLQGHSNDVTSVAINHDGTKILSGSEDKTLRIWDMITGSLINTLQGHNGSVYTVSISADGTKIVSGSDDNTIRIWDMDVGMLTTLQGHYNWVYSVAISQDGMKIVSGSGDHSVKVWDAGTGRLIWTTNPRLYCKGTRINRVTGLSDVNRRLLLQRGAVRGFNMTFSIR
ncbi:repeat-containing protein [Candidatus Magnetobacterium bavaricum]|uniref:Repeat-containing protein n=1 Tax=Candidatus Magnetobacterium bavaricum TaxID=29290 RepID=A0A0F3GQ50_9BACT|nr:repeat-containing protein [Candidatus Magnetobacterium bavaricum]